MYLKLPLLSIPITSRKYSVRKFGWKLWITIWADSSGVWCNLMQKASVVKITNIEDVKKELLLVHYARSSVWIEFNFELSFWQFKVLNILSLTVCGYPGIVRVTLTVTDTTVVKCSDSPGITMDVIRVTMDFLTNHGLWCLHWTCVASTSVLTMQSCLSRPSCL